MARLCGSTLRTVRFYEEAGLLAPSGRSDGGHRLFERGELLKLQLILDLREAGLSLSDIRALFELKRECGTPEQASVRMAAILERQIDEMQKKIAKLRCLREELSSTVSVIRECHGCTDSRFPVGCSECEVMQRSELPRAVRLLWS
jgi:DNA-binding transcriptional MerR regulator